jgi:membrane-associated protein
MIPGFDLIQFAQSTQSIVVLIVIAAIIFAESGLMIGFFLPGDSVLFTLGFLISGTTTFKLDLNIHIVVATLFIAATAGYVVGYLFGKKIGPHLANRPNSRFFHQSNVQKAQDFYNQYGGKTVIIARFIPIVRTFVPLIAGIVKMPFKQFMTYNLVGGVIWIGGVTYAGYFLGYYLRRLGIDIDTILLPVVALILIASVSPAIYHLLKDKNQREAIWNETKIQFKKIILRKR